MFYFKTLHKTLRFAVQSVGHDDHIKYDRGTRGGTNGRLPRISSRATERTELPRGNVKA